MTPIAFEKVSKGVTSNELSIFTSINDVPKRYNYRRISGIILTNPIRVPGIPLKNASS